MEDPRDGEGSGATRQPPGSNGRVQTEVTGAVGGPLLRIEGRLPPGWAGALSLGLSRRGIAILRGFARRTPRGLWIAEFHMRTGPASTDPRSINYAALMTAEAAGSSRVPIRLESHRMERPVPGGTLFLEITGQDRVGFLGSLLDQFASLSLFPEEMEVETLANVALDRFRLRATGGRSPSEGSERALQALLRSLGAAEAPDTRSAGAS